ncbi:MAG: cell division protein FtsA [Candidatus Bruticola sp.]
MAKLETIAALDIGTGKVACAIAEFSRDDAGFDILGSGCCECHGLVNGSFINVDETAEAIEKAVGEAEKSGYSVSKVLVSISSEAVYSTYGSGMAALTGARPGVTKRDMSTAFANAKQVGVPAGYEIATVVPLNFLVDNVKVFHPEGIVGHSLDSKAYICLASSVYLQNVRNILDKVGLEVYKGGLIPSSLASSLAVLSEEERRLGVMMIDMGLGTLDLAICSDGEIVYSSVLGRGGDRLILDVARYFNIKESEASNLIRSYGCACADLLDEEAKESVFVAESVSPGINVTISKLELAQVLEAQINEQIDWVEEQMKLVSDNLGIQVRSIVLTGGASLLSLIDKKFQNRLGGTTRVARPCYPSHLSEKLADPIYSTLVGLLIYGASRLPAQERQNNSSNHPRNLIQRIIDFFYRMF